MGGLARTVAFDRASKVWKQDKDKNKEKLFFGLLDGTYAKIWDCYPTEKAIVRPTLVFVDPAHRTFGLSHVLIEYGLDLPTRTHNSPKYWDYESLRLANGLFLPTLLPTMSKQTGANICATHLGQYNAYGFLPFQGWFEKNGHTLAHTTGPNVTNWKGETVTLPEGPLRVYAADMQTVKTINVKPCWEFLKAVGTMP
ncbi:hypothetical protein PRIPAC_86713 [Pristionchus pacificus]|uniref:Uncharacterized protein n=1 Tax=Pristionchus pacificus TaxID=54126 RepID=A0A2A6BTR2_PRIPA|nr:hypothetical protein PRIPAC_86713 [Pristionchus pacificus]|eukprot:PDM69206.1 hypothetical protein PRIPAC_47508 [Pristionchus pacificus]